MFASDLINAPDEAQNVDDEVKLLVPIDVCRNDLDVIRYSLAKEGSISCIHHRNAAGIEFGVIERSPRLVDGNAKRTGNVDVFPSAKDIWVKFDPVSIKWVAKVPTF